MTPVLVGTAARTGGRLAVAARVTAIFALVHVGACSIEPTVGQGPSAHLRVVQAIPNAPIVDVVVDDAAPVITGLNFRSATGFARVEGGMRRIRLVSNAPTTTVLDDSVFFEYPRALTVIATGMLGGVEAVIAQDTAGIPDPGFIAIRVLQASPSAGTVDMYVTDNNADLATATPIHTNMPFRGNSEYFYLPTARYRVRLTAAGTKNVVYDVTQVFQERTMRTVVMFDATGGGLPVGGILLVDF